MQGVQDWIEEGVPMPRQRLAAGAILQMLGHIFENVIREVAESKGLQLFFGRTAGGTHSRTLPVFGRFALPGGASSMHPLSGSSLI
jgi:hypothetical protein